MVIQIDASLKLNFSLLNFFHLLGQKLSTCLERISCAQEKVIRWDFNEQIIDKDSWY